MSDQQKKNDALAVLFNAARNEQPNQDGTMMDIRPVSRMEEEDEDYKGVNQVLIYRFQKNRPIIYVPCYLRMKVNRVSNINYIEGQAAIETDVRLWVMMKQFPAAVQEQIMNLAKIDINNKTTELFADIIEPKKLDSSYKKNISKHAQGFLITQEMELDIESDPFWSPFELVKLISLLQIKKITLGDHDHDLGKKLSTQERDLYLGTQIQFNWMDAHPFLQFAFGEVSNLGSFDIAESVVDMQFTAEAGEGEDEDNGDEKYYEEQFDPLNAISNIINLKEKIRTDKFRKGQLTPDAYEHGRILIPLYKYPTATLINIFVPFYMVAILSLGVFFEANDMSNRSASLATFQLAYIAFFPTIRETLPETPKLVFAEILIYIQATVTLICFFYSLKVNGVEGYNFDWDSDVTFLVCLALTALNIAVIVAMVILHKCKWEPEYNRLPDGAIDAMQQPVINTDDHTEWWNPACEQEFKQPIAMGLVKPMFPHRKKKMRGTGSKGNSATIHPAA